MICVQLMGGLGNQLFQYAFMRHIEEMRFPEVYLDMHWFAKEKARGEEWSRVFELDKLQTVYREIDCGGRSPCGRIAYETEGWDEMLLATNDVFCCGWWQDLKYYPYVLKDLQKECRIKEELIDGEMKQIIARMEDCLSVSVHIRRTDYLTPFNSRVFASCTKDYYARAVSHIKEATGKVPTLFVFSDDHAYAKAEYTGFEGCETVFVETGVSYKDMHLMSRARHNIIANSTFSWWAAFQNTGEGHITVAPANWYLDRDNPNLYFSDWIIL